jgi:hypothetical protein
MSAKKELAFYYPNPMWHHGNWVKNLILFFDGVALLGEFLASVRKSV